MAVEFGFIRKSFDVVIFLLLFRMTREDWIWLDIYNIRTVAFNRIARMIMNGELFGFYDIRLPDHRGNGGNGGGEGDEIRHRNKDRYLQPGDKKGYDNFSESDGPYNTGFGNEAEVDGYSEDALALLRILRGLSALELTALDAIITALVLEELLEPEEQTQAEQIDESHLEDLRREDAEVLTVIMMMWALDSAEANRLLENLDENSSPAEVRSEVRAIKRERYRLAAGRGL